MTKRVAGRHRAPVRPKTPLSFLSAAAGEHLGAVGRTAGVVAASSGLVLSMGLPADAVTTSAPAAAPTVVPEVAALTALADSATTVSAPATAQTSFATTTALTAEVTPPPAAEPAAAVSAVQPGPERVGRPAAKEAVAQARVAAAAPVQGGGAGGGVLSVASRYTGIPYRYGGTTPAGFDCSGFTSFVYAKVGVALPRTATAQLHATRRISSAEARAGDLVFVVRGGGASHVGIYAGNGMMYDSPHSGASSSKRKIFSSSLAFGRV